MAENSTSSFKLFYRYAREDRALRDELDLHLSGLKRQRYITSWPDRDEAFWGVATNIRSMIQHLQALIKTEIIQNKIV